MTDARTTGCRASISPFDDRSTDENTTQERIVVRSDVLNFGQVGATEDANLWGLTRTGAGDDVMNAIAVAIGGRNSNPTHGTEEPELIPRSNQTSLNWANGWRER